MGEGNRPVFGLFKSAPFEDPRLGTLSRSRGKWRGTISFASHRNVPLRLSGGGKAPDPASLDLARQLPARFAELRPQIESQLYEHYEPYRESADAGGLPGIDRAEDVWLHVSPVHVLAAPLDGAPAPGLVLEIAYAVAWDEEHTVGARIQGGRLFELCGSVID